MSAKRFGTAEGVFVPCLLSILGVIMYLRLGWVVGHVGLKGALLIILIANIITLLTAFSMSSVITNIRIGAGGAYSIITKSLGVEAGGAIGIPLYISQAISSAFYLIGFAECWLFVFPEHNLTHVALVLWLVLSFIAFLSTKLAFKIQNIILTIIFLSLVTVMFGNRSHSIVEISSSISTLGFWHVFAVFFPAVTGILAGASMSGELSDPRRSIPVGTIAAILVSLVIYVCLSVVFSAVPAATLISNPGVIIEIGGIPNLVIAGIMGATLSSALTMLVAAPRVLMALSKNKIVPFSHIFEKTNSKGEPVVAVLFTAFIVFLTILNSSLNQIAVLLTMFFLITYGMINLIVFIEQTIGIISFRPTFKVSRLISFVGGFGCLGVMFLIDSKFTFISIASIIIIYFFLIKKEAQVYSPDIRSGTLMYLAEQFAKAASKLPYYPKIWKPNILYPVYQIENVEKYISIVRSIVYPAGRLTLIHVAQGGFDQREDVKLKLQEQVKDLHDEGVFIESAVIRHQDKLEGAQIALQVVNGLFFPPNTMFYVIEEDKSQDDYCIKLLKDASKEGLGIILLNYDHQMGFAQQKIINLWIRQQSPNINLSILIALQLEKNWEGSLKIIQVVYHEQDKAEAYEYLQKLKHVMRISPNVEVEVLVGKFIDVIKDAPIADINIFGMQAEADLDMVRNVTKNIRTSVLFLRDSKHESALA